VTTPAFARRHPLIECAPVRAVRGDVQVLEIALRELAIEEGLFTAEDPALGRACRAARSGPGRAFRRERLARRSSSMGTAGPAQRHRWNLSSPHYPTASGSSPDEAALRKYSRAHLATHKCHLLIVLPMAGIMPGPRPG